MIVGTSPVIDMPVAVADLPPARSLVDALSHLSASIPTDIAYTFLPDGEGVEQNLTFRELEWQARSVAARLQQMARPGDRAALVYESGLEYIAAMTGCFYAGVVAVPIYPPDPMRMHRTGARLQAILEDAEATLVLTGRSEFERFGGYLSDSETVLVTDEVPVEEGIDWKRPEIGPDTLALLQYTSGSTGRPRGVMLSHSNLMFNFEHIKRFDEPNAVAVSWLPMYHDMGLIGLVLQVLQSGRRTVLMSPLSFVKRPVRWLQAISKYRAYATSGPSFAYDLCVQKVSDEDLARLDLSCWTLACNGAEPVRADTLERFAKRFAPAGFCREAFYPCYGLAEATLIVSGGDKSTPPVVRSYDAEQLTVHRVKLTPQGPAPKEIEQKSRAIVGCGRGVDRQEIAIVDPETRRRCAADEVGEIWVRGPGVAAGYWNDREATQETFNAFTSETHDGPYLRTGDTGFLDRGELFVTGRLKDLVIIRGRNHYPQDLERTVEGCHPLLRRDHGVAFGVEIKGEERAVIVFGVGRTKKIDFDQLFAAIRGALLHEHEIAPYAIVLVRGREIPKTSSGKLQRRACKEFYESGELDIVAEWRADAMRGATAEVNGEAAPRNEATDRSAKIVQTIAGMIRELKEDNPPETINANSLLFADLSIESIDLVVLNELVEQHFQCDFPFTDFMAELGREDQRDVSVGQFADFILTSLGTPGGKVRNDL